MQRGGVAVMAVCAGLSRSTRYSVAQTSTAVFAATVMVPAVWHLVTWIERGVVHSPPGSAAFCEAIGAGLVCLMPYAVALGLFDRDHAPRLAGSGRLSGESAAD